MRSLALSLLLLSFSSNALPCDYLGEGDSRLLAFLLCETMSSGRDIFGLKDSPREIGVMVPANDSDRMVIGLRFEGEDAARLDSAEARLALVRLLNGNLERLREMVTEGKIARLRSLLPILDKSKRSFTFMTPMAVGEGAYRIVYAVDWDRGAGGDSGLSHRSVAGAADRLGL